MSSLIDLVKELAKGVSLVLAEDEAGVRQSMADLFQNFFERLYLCSNGREALEVWQRERAQLIVTDVRMPDMDGIELARRVRTIDPWQRILVVSAYSDTESLLNLLNQGVSGFLLKPVDIPSLLETLLRELRLIRLQSQERQLTHRLEQEVEKRTQELDRANQDLVRLIQSRETMLRLVAHEIRTPINAIAGFHQLLQASLGPRPDLKPMFDSMREAIQRLDSSTQKALDLIRLERSSPKEGGWIRLAEYLSPPLSRRTVLLNQVRLKADNVLLSLTIQNIVENMERYGQPPFTVAGTVEGPELRLFFRDHGTGFPRTILLSKGGGPFTTGDLYHHQKGLGLGLALIDRCLERLGWSWQLDNHPEGGAVVEIRVPQGDWNIVDESDNNTP